jgi:ADP-ribosyl-[dinitrogen reductase] hydrolase
MLIEMAVADAYGVGWEFTNAQHGANDLSCYRRHPTYGELEPGRYTDDTQRAVANSTVVLSGEHRWYQPASYAKAYMTEYAFDPREGWSKRFQAYLKDHRHSTPENFMKGLRRRETNGALMGVAPLGHLPNEDAVRLATTMQTVSTHSGSAAQYAQAVSLSAHYLMFDKGPRSDLPRYLADEVEWDGSGGRSVIDGMKEDPPKARMPAKTVAAAALWAVLNLDSLSDIMRWCIDKGDDTDSLAAVAVAIASCSSEIANDVPPALLDTLENQETRDRLVHVDARLKALAGIGPRPKALRR